MPGEIAIYLLGAQGGVADDFARLHAVTNPVLLRYLRVTADGDHEELARTAWTAALPQLQVCPPDDDAWLELVVGAARTAVVAGDGASSLPPAGTSTAPSTAPVTARSAASTASDDSHSDPLSEAIAALRACPPAEAEVLAMGAVANLGREAMSRLTGLEPNAVLALVLQAQQHLRVSLEALIDALRVPATAAELADLPFAARLFSAVAPASPARAAAAAPAAAVAIGVTAASGPALPGPGASFGALPQPSVVDIHSLQSTAPANAQRAATWGHSRSVRVGAGAAAWLLAVGGISTAAAMSGLLSVAVDGILGGRDRGPLVTAEGPIVPGPLPSSEPTPSGTPATEDPSTGPGTTPPDSSDGDSTGSGGDDTVTTPRQPTDVRIVLTSFDVPDPVSPATPAPPAPGPTPTPTPTIPPVTPPTVPPTTPPTLRPLAPANHGNGNGKAEAKAKAKATGQGHTKHAGKQLATGHAKQHGNGLATGHAKPATATDAKAAKAAAKAATKAAKAKSAKAKSAAKQAGTASAHTNQGKR